MKICGLQKTTLLDFPGKVAATIFTGGCNFRCPFCHNSQLLEHKADIALPEDEVLAFLKKRRNILEGLYHWRRTYTAARSGGIYL